VAGHGRALHEALAQRFAHPDGGFFRTPSDHEALLAREKPAYDGAEPTGNSVAALTLLRLEALTGESAFRDQADKLLRSFGALLGGAPAALGEMLLALDFYLAEPREVVLVRRREDRWGAARLGANALRALAGAGAPSARVSARHAAGGRSPGPERPAYRLRLREGAPASCR